MYLIGIPNFPALLEDFNPFICLKISLYAIGRKKKEFFAFIVINDVAENAQSVAAEILLLKKFLTFTKYSLNALLTFFGF